MASSKWRVIWNVVLAVLLVCGCDTDGCEAKTAFKSGERQHRTVESLPHAFLRIVNLPGVSQGDFAEQAVGHGATVTGVGVFPARGLHVSEYANHQLLLSRTNGLGPPELQAGDWVQPTKPLIFGSRVSPHIYSQLPPNIVPTYSGTMMATRYESKKITFFTGMMKLPEARTGQGGKTPPNPVLFANDGSLSDFLNLNRPELSTATKVMLASIKSDRLLFRILQIKPDFDPASLEALLSETVIPMGTKALIFLGNDNQMHCLLETDARVDRLAPWLRAIASSPLDVQPLSVYLSENQMELSINAIAFVGPRGMLDPKGALFANGDWGFNPIWTNNMTGTMTLVNVPVWDMLTFTPGSGSNGLLGELQLRSFINAGCTLTVNSRPTDCPCTCTKPEWMGSGAAAIQQSEFDAVYQLKSNCGNYGPD